MSNFDSLLSQVKGKRVFYRADFNVPFDGDSLRDDTRIKLAIPALQKLKKAGAKVIIATHLGRPQKVDLTERKATLSAKRLLPHLEKLLGCQIGFCSELEGEMAVELSQSVKDGDFLLMENLRFSAGEEKNDKNFAEELAKLCDTVVVDAFACSHRKHASVHALTFLLPAVAGPLVEQEVKMLSKLCKNPPKPSFVILAGSKISTKIGVIKNLANSADRLLIAGGMANTLLKAKGYELGKSLVEKESLDLARELLESPFADKIVLPEDLAVVKKFPEQGKNIDAVQNKLIADLDKDDIALDLGEETIKSWQSKIADAGSILWNGPLGMFEVSPFDVATIEVAKTVAQLTKQGNLLSLAGGGDTLAALAKAISIDDLTYYSTAGGAFMEFVEGKKLPVISALGL